MVVTIGAVKRAKLSQMSPPTNKYQAFYRPEPTKNIKALKGKISHFTDLLSPRSPGSFSSLILDHKMLLVTWLTNLSSAPDASTPTQHLEQVILGR